MLTITDYACGSAHPLAQLSFVQPSEDLCSIVSLWGGGQAGCDGYASECARGVDLAEEALAFMRDGERPTLLGAIMRDMVAAGAWGGVEIGFVHHFAEAAIASA